jgi:hypothetical protein
VSPTVSLPYCVSHCFSPAVSRIASPSHRVSHRDDQEANATLLRTVTTGPEDARITLLPSGPVITFSSIVPPPMGDCTGRLYMFVAKVNAPRPPPPLSPSHTMP